jgi:hypothetical protein
VRWLSILSRAITRKVDVHIIEAILDTGVYYRQSGLLSNLAKAYSDKQRMRLRDFFRYFDSDYKQTIIQLAEECSYQTSLICSSHLKSRRISMRLGSLHLDSEFGSEGRYSSLPYFLPQWIYTSRGSRPNITCDKVCIQNNSILHFASLAAMWMSRAKNISQGEYENILAHGKHVD